MGTVVITIPWVFVILGAVLFLAVWVALAVLVILLVRRRKKGKPVVNTPPRSMVRCLRCGMEADPQFQFCPGCGYVLRS